MGHMTNMIITAPTAAASEPPILSSPFWPEIDPVAIREAQRIDNTVTPPRLRDAIIEAIAASNNAMIAWRGMQETAGIASLADVPADEIDGESINIHRYRRAVGCLAKALLLERYRDYDSTARADRQAEALRDPIDDCRRDHQFAIADIIGRTRSTVELI